MPADTTTTDLSRRLAALSPGKLAALQKRLIQTTAGDRSSPAEEIPVQPRGKQRDFPLSSAQERMWFNHQWSPERPLYNESFAIQIDGDLQVDALRQSFDMVMARHEIFTITFHSVDGRLLQRIGSCSPPQLETCDLRELEEPRREAAYEAESRRLLREPFRLDQGPLFRAGLWIMSDGRYRLLFVMHHIIFDGWSGGIFFRELFTAYSALAAGRQPEFPPLRTQYIDFAVWEQSHFEQTAAALDRQLEYWKKQLDGLSGAPPLPVDHHLPADGAHVAGREVFVCPPDLVDAVRELAKEAGATLFMALLTVFNVLLARYSGEEDIVVGLPTVNRNQSALSDVIGVFINTVILRTDLSGDVTFRELLGRVRKSTLDAQANQELPLQRVVRHLGLNGDAGRSLVRVLFDLQKKSASLVEPPGFSIEQIDVSSGAAKADLVMAMEDTGAHLKGVLDYDAEKFEAATARRWPRHFLALLKSAVAQPDIPVGLLPMLTVEEIAHAEARGADTSCHPQPIALIETLARAQERPDAIALADQYGVLTYGELHTRASRLAAVLRRNNVSSGRHIALLLPPGVDFAVAQLAVMMAGAAFVPIDPAYPPARIEFTLRDCEAACVIVNSHSPDTLPEWASTIRMDHDGVPANSAENPAQLSDLPVAQAADPAYLIYTSGSTGQPKGVSVSHAALANLIAWHRRVFAVSSHDRATQLASVAFDASIWEIWPYLAAGASIHFPSRELIGDPAGLRDWMVKNKITMSFAPTPLAEDLIDLRWPFRMKLRYLLTGGDRLRKSPPRSLPFTLVNNYGPTENAVVATSGTVPPAANGAAPPIGHPIDNVWTRVVDRALQPVPRGVVGELLIGGRSLASGYWNRPELTAQHFLTLADGERAYRTGDLCRLRHDGEIEFMGRTDSQVKVRGCRIELGEIESALLAHHGIRAAAADVRELAGGQRVVVAYIVAEAATPAPQMLRTYLGSRMPTYMIPSCFVPMDALPQTSNGKIDRRRLPTPQAEEESPEQIGSRTTTEDAIASLWKELLNVAAVGVQDDFFQLGGDSLSATRFAVAVREKFGVELPLARMMSAPTVQAVAAFIDRARRPNGETPAALPEGLILLRSGSDSQPPLFLTPPASGSPACYAVMAGALSSDRTVYGFEASGLTTGKPAAGIADQARRCVAALDAVYPSGPCFIAGWSLGGPVAFELACQLRDAGREVAFLALIDAGLPEDGMLPGGASMMVPLWWAISYPFVEHVPLNYQTFRMLARWVGITLPESLADVWRRGPVAGTQFAAGLLSSGWRSFRVFLASVKGFQRYQPRSFDGGVTLFRTAQGGRLDNGQNALLKNLQQWSRHVEVHEAPGSHMTLMLDAKISSAFASSFDATLNSGFHGRIER